MEYCVREISEEVFSSELPDFKYSLFLTLQWLKSLEEKNRTPIYLEICDQSKVVGLLSGIVIKSLFYHKEVYFYSEPALVDYNSTNLNKCYQALINFAATHKLARITVSYLDQQSNILPDDNRFKIKPTNEYIIQLKTDYLTFKPGHNFSNKIKKAERLHPEFVIETSPNTVDKLVDMLQYTHDLRMQKNRHDYDIFTYKFVNQETLKRLVQLGGAVFYCAKTTDNYDYISLCLECDIRAYELYNGTNEIGYANGLTGWMVKKRSERYQNLNYQYFNMGGVPHEMGDKDCLAGFKMQSGCSQKQVYIATSEFLCYPERIFNKIFNVGRLMPYNRVIRFLIKYLG